MRKIIGKRSIMFLSMALILILATACSNENETEASLGDLTGTTWETGQDSIYFTIGEDTVKISIRATAESKPSDFKLDTFDLDKYIIDEHENVTIEEEGNTLKLYNDEKLDLEFEILSETELEDKDGNVFKKQ